MKKLIVIVLFVILLVFAVMVVNQFFSVRKAHSSFENYYNFRGCVQLIKRTPTYGIRKLASGKTIKLVAVNGKWYLDGDLPVCYFNFCL